MQNRETLRIQKTSSSQEDVPKVWLYNKKDKEFNPKVIQIFKKWFVEFSEEGKMDVKAIANFITIVTE